MGFFGKIKKGIKGIGRLAQKAAPFVGMIPGVGTLAAAGIGGIGGALSGGGFKGALKGAALGAAGGLIGKIPGVGRLAGKIGGAVKGAGIGSALKGVGGFLKDNPELALGGLSAIQNAHQTSRFEGLQNEQLDFSRKEMERQQQLRDMLMQRFQNFNSAPQNFDQSAVFADQGNPFFQGA